MSDENEFNEDVEKGEIDSGIIEIEEDIKPTFISRPAVAGRKSSNHLWLISYADFMTILMIFFLAMYGYTHLAKQALLNNKKKLITYSEFTHLVNGLQGEGENIIDITENKQKIQLSLPESLLFDSGRADLGLASQRTIDVLANSIKLVAGDIVVEGHTDNVPLTGGKFKSNWELSAARAFSVIEALSAKGVTEARLSAWGFGKNRPVADNRTKEGRAKNRRIEIILLKDEKNTRA